MGIGSAHIRTSDSLLTAGLHVECNGEERKHAGVTKLAHPADSHSGKNVQARLLAPALPHYGINLKMWQSLGTKDDLLFSPYV